MDARRLRLSTVLAVAAFAGLTLLTGTQPWWVVELADASVEVGGTVASPALPALALSSLALAAALAIAGPFFRVVLAVLQFFVGLTVVVASWASVSDPVSASASLITDATGVDGAVAVASLVQGVALTAWPWLATASGALAALTGVLLAATVRRWPHASRKYQPARLEAAEGDPIGDWDALSDGSDPTSR